MGGDAIVPKLDVVHVIKEMWVDEFVRSSLENRKRDKLKRKMMKNQIGMLGLAARMNDAGTDDGSKSRSDAGSFAMSGNEEGRASLLSLSGSNQLQATGTRVRDQDDDGDDDDDRSSSASSSSAPGSKDTPARSLAGEAMDEPDSGRGNAPAKLKHLPKSLRQVDSALSPAGTLTPSPKLSIHASRQQASTRNSPVAGKF